MNHCYGVLSVNFRGSARYGKELQAKEFKEFSRAMQDDFADTADCSDNNGFPDPAAMGASHGRYSAALAMTRDPDLFDAAVVEFPMFDCVPITISRRLLEQ